MSGHVQPEWPVTFSRNGRSRSSGISGHDGPETQYRRRFATLPIRSPTKKSRLPPAETERTPPQITRLLPDESCDFTVVVHLRDAGHDVVSIVEQMPDVQDE